MRTNIFAYTPAGNANPAYISVNREDDDRLTVAAAIGAHLEATAPAEVEPAPVKDAK